MDIQPVHGMPVLRAGDMAVVGDLHIGVETHLVRRGFHLPSRTWDMCDSLMSLDDWMVRLVVIGDVKDSVPGSSRQEFREIPEFFERLSERFDRIDVVRGNHDTNIEDFLPSRVRLHPASGLLVEDVGLVHGHTWPSDRVMGCDTLIMAHNHPTVMLVDGIGRASTEPCWVRGRSLGPSGRYDRVPGSFIVVPAFNPMLGGSPVNVDGEALLGPILNSGIMDLGGAGIHLLDGVSLGRVGDLTVSRGRRGRYVRNGRMEK